MLRLLHQQAHRAWLFQTALRPPGSEKYSCFYPRLGRDSGRPEGRLSAVLTGRADLHPRRAARKPRSGWVDETQTAKLTASDGASDNLLGLSVAISGDTVVAGADLVTVGANALQGAAYVFVKPRSGWADEPQTAKLTASGGASLDRLGVLVAVCGGTVIAGAPGATVDANLFQGAAYVFSRTQRHGR
jgi:hypothetical protein